jgi:hypothetical protein
MANVSWFDEFLGVALPDRYSVSITGSGKVGVAANPSIGGWVEVSTAYTGLGSSLLRLNPPSSGPYDGSGVWTSVGEQRVLINTALDTDATIGFIARDDGSTIGGALLYRSDLGQWIFQTGSGGQYTNIATNWVHTPGQAFTIRIETGPGYSAAFIDDVEVARSTTNIPSGHLWAWDTQIWNKPRADEYSVPRIWVDYLWVEHDDTTTPVRDPIDQVMWRDDFDGSELGEQYWTSGTGSIQKAAFGNWLELQGAAGTAESIRLRLGEDPAVSPHDAMNWYAGANVIGEQRVMVSTTEDIDLTIGFMSRDDPTNIGGGLLYRSDLQQWLFQTGSDNEYTNILTGWNHTPGEAFTVRIETGSGFAAAYIDGVEVARSITNVPSDIPYTWENQLWSHPDGSSSTDPTLWIDYMLIEQERGEDAEFNKPISQDNWISGSREGFGRVHEADPDWQIQGVGDFTGDGTHDLLMRDSLGTVAIWKMQDGVYAGQSILRTNVEPFWQIQGTGDFNGDGTQDILLRSAQSGTAVTWSVKGGKYVAQTVAFKNADKVWEVQGTGDFNGDGTQDVLLRSTHSGTIITWLMKNGVFASQTVVLKNYNMGWNIQGTGDFNGDGTDDILLRSATSGTVVSWAVKKGAFAGQQVVEKNLSMDWQLRDVGDVHGDGIDDLFLWNTADNSLAVLSMKNGVSAARNVIVEDAGPLWQMSAVADFTGEGGSDVLWRHSSSGDMLAWDLSAEARGLHPADFFII